MIQERWAGTRFAASVTLGVLAATGMAGGQSADYARANYTKFEYRIPMRDGVKLFTSVYVPKDRGEDVPILMTRTPYSVAPYGADAYKASLGPSDRFMRDGYIFVYQDVRGRMMSEGQFADMRPHLPVKSGAADVDESTDTYDTIEWLLKNVPNHNGRVGMYGISYPGFYTSAGMIDAHPALKAASPQAPIADWFIGDDFHHNGALYLPHAFSLLLGLRPAAAEADDEFGIAVQLRHRGRLPVLPEARADAERECAPLQGRDRVLERPDGARDVRRLLAGPEPAAAPEEHQARRHDRRRLVRRGRPVRRPRDLQERRAPEPWRVEHARDGALGPRRMVQRERRLPRRRPLRVENRRVLPRRDRVSLLLVPPEGQGRPEAARGVRLRDRAQPVAPHGRVAASGRRGEGPLPGAGRQAAVAAARRRRGLRPVRQRSREARAVHQPHRHRHDA